MKTSARRALTATLAALIAAVWLAPVASAQLPDTGSVGGSVGGVTDTVGGVTDTVGGTTDTVGDTTKDTSGTIGEVTDPVTGGGGSGSTGDPIGEITKTVDKTVNDTSKTVNDTSGTLNETTGGTTGSTTDSITRTISDTTGSAGNTLDPTIGRVTGDNKSTKERAAGSGGSTSTSFAAAGWLRALNLASTAGTELPETRRLSMASSYAPDETGEGFLSKLGRIASEAAEQMAFPLALTLLVVGFLVVQGRIDRKDPKLALAPVDAEHDLLSFS